jgi:hypothetical protein
MKKSEVFYVMYIHYSDQSKKENRLAIFYNRDNLQPRIGFELQVNSRNPSEYDMLEMVYITKYEFNKMKRYYESSGILRPKGVGIPEGHD